MQAMYNKWIYEMIIHYYMDWFVLTQVFSLLAHIFPRAAIYIPVRFIRHKLTHLAMLLRSHVNLCIFKGK